MENASKALLIAGGMLVTMLVLSIGVYLFNNFSNTATEYQKTEETAEIQQYNANFIKFEEKTDIKIHEIITLVNFAKQYNKQTETSISIKLGTEELNVLEDDKIIEKISEKANEEFTCKEMKDNDEDGRIDLISFVKTN